MCVPEHVIGRYQNLSADTFDEFLGILAESMKSTGYEVIQLLVSKLAFSGDARSISVQSIEDMEKDKNDEELDSFDVAVLRARMLIVFDMMKHEGNDTVHFKEVAKRLSRFTGQYMDAEQRQLLPMMSAEENRSTSFQEFLELGLNIMAACSHNGVDFHEIANVMTLSVCPAEACDADIADLFLNHEAYERALQDGAEADKSRISFRLVSSTGCLIKWTFGPLR